jgi:hypothetical protein
VNEEFFAKVDKLAMHNPGIDLVKKHFMAFKQNARIHRLYNWIASLPFLTEEVDQLTPLQSFILYLVRTLNQRWKQLKVQLQLQ